MLRELLFGSRRFNDLRKGVPLMSPTLLLETPAGLSRRRESSSGCRARPGKGWEYQPTNAGQEDLRPVVEMLGVWGQRWVRSRPDHLMSSTLAC